MPNMKDIKVNVNEKAGCRVTAPLASPSHDAMAASLDAVAAAINPPAAPPALPPDPFATVQKDETEGKTLKGRRTQGHALARKPASQQPAVIEGTEGKYEFIEEIGSGGMSNILLVKDRHLRRQVAMKLIGARQRMLSPALSDRFLAEAQTTGQLEHPNIVPIHDLGVLPDGRPFFTMKLVRGETLAEVLDRLAEGDRRAKETYSLQRMLAIFQQIANGLGFAHARSVIHRDLKPENIMLGEFGEVLILDWGIAKSKLANAAPRYGASGNENQEGNL